MNLRVAPKPIERRETPADYFEAACLRRVKIERKRLPNSIVMEPPVGRVWKRWKKPRKRKAKR